MTGRRRAATLAALVLVAGCSWSAGRSTGQASVQRLTPTTGEPATTTAPQASTTSTTMPAAQQECEVNDWQTASYRPEPSGDGPPVAALREPGTLRVGVDETTLGFASRNTSTGEFDGFEVELARVIARQLFGDAYDPDSSLVLVPVDPGGSKTKSLQNGLVDMTIDAVTMTCDRWNAVDFSAEYYTAHQQFLVRPDSGIAVLGDLSGKRVCVTEGSSSLRLLQGLIERGLLHDVVIDPVPDRTRCLVELQDGEVDAYFGHDSFLAGMRVQDANLEQVDLLDQPDSVSHYGIAIAKGHTDLVRFVNGVLESMHADGRWDALFEELQTELPTLDDAAQPDPAYRDAPA